MSYPNAHLYLTVHWSAQSSSNEFGQFGLRFDSTAPATQVLVDNCAQPVSTFWSAATNGVDFAYALQYIRLASIGTDGKYVPGSVAFDHTYPGGVAGGGSGGSAVRYFPLQVAAASTLLTAMPRGQAYKGRIYLPYIATPLDGSWHWPLANCNNRTNGLAAMISALNGVMPGDAAVFSKGTKAAPTVGAKQTITGVQTGNRPDVQRRRAAQLAESYSIVGTVNP